VEARQSGCHIAACARTFRQWMLQLNSVNHAAQKGSEDQPSFYTYNPQGKTARWCMATLPAFVCRRRVIGRFPCVKQTLTQTRFSFKSTDRKSKITLSTQKNEHALRSKTEIYGSKTHWTDSDVGDTTAFFGIKLFYLPFPVLSLREILDKFSHVLIFILCFSVEKQPARSPAASFFRFLDHTELDIHTWYDSSEIVISPSQRLLLTQHATNTTDENPRPQRESNPRFQQSSSRRPTP